MRIRPAKNSDLYIWASMRTELWPDSRQVHLEELQAYFAGTAVDIELALIAANRSDTAVGFMELNIRNFAEGSRNAAVPYVEGWFVSAEHRNQGIGQQLMANAEAWARSNGYRELASDTEIDNTASIAIHKHLGFAETERVVCFLKQLK